MPPRPAPTHFLCIPLGGPQLAQSLASFKANVTSPAGGGIPADAVRPLGTLHLTLGVMTLRDETLSRAVELLRNLRLSVELVRALAASSPSATSPPAEDAAAAATNEKPGAADASASPPRHLRISLAGLEAMHNPSRTSVLYVPPRDARGELLRFCEGIRRPFLESGLMADEGRPLLLHGTVVNTIYVRGRGGSGSRQRGRREALKLDARDVLARYEGHVWMEDEVVDRVTLCRMGAKEVEGSGGDAAYEVVAEASF